MLSIARKRDAGIRLWVGGGLVHQLVQGALLPQYV